MKRTSKMSDYVRIGDGRIEAGLSLFRYEENGIRIVYSPSLNVIGYGRTYEEADSDFDFCLDEFFKSSIGNGSFETEMSSLGWKKEERQLTSPTLQEILPRRDVLRDIFNNRDYRKTNRSLSFQFA